jgi:hypothetical protein
VGGQSLTAWVQYYKIELPSFEGPYLTADADFLGTRREAEVIARFLNGNFEAPEMGDPTPNAAIVVFTGERGEKLNIDILTGVLGVPDKLVKKLAISLKIDDCEGIDVMSVVDQSKMPQPFERSWIHEIAEVARKREIVSRPPKRKLRLSNS